MRRPLSPNPQTISSLYKHGYTFAGRCWSCKPTRHLTISMSDLIALKGPNYLVRDAIKRITCKECGSPLDLQVAPAEDHEPFDFSLAWTSVAHPPSEVGPKRL